MKQKSLTGKTLHVKASKSPKVKHLTDRIKIDEINAKILKILLKDSRTSFTDIAKICHISVGAVKMRYKHLWKVGVINGEIMQVNPYGLGYNCVGNIGINTSTEHEEALMESLKKRAPLTITMRAWAKYNVGLIVVKKNIEDWVAELRRLDSTPHIKRVDPLIWIDGPILDHPENLVIKPFENSKFEFIIDATPSVNRAEQTKMDDTDRQIAKILTHSSRTSFRQIAKQLGISTKKVIQRYKKLRENILIVSTVTLDLKKLGYNASTFIFLKCDRSKMAEISKTILQMPNILVFYRAIGSYDLVAVCALEDFNDFIRLQKQVRVMQGVEQIEFFITPIFPAWPANIFASLLD